MVNRAQQQAEQYADEKTTTVKNVVASELAAIGVGGATAAAAIPVAGHIQKNGFKNSIIQAKDNIQEKAQNFDAGETVDDIKKKTGEIFDAGKENLGKTIDKAKNIGKEGAKNAGKAGEEATEGIIDNVKDKAKVAYNATKDGVTDLTSQFKNLDKKAKAAVVTLATIAALVTGKVTHDKMNESTIDPKIARINGKSENVRRGETKELLV